MGFTEKNYICPMAKKDIVRIGILDLYEGAANQGMRCIREIIHQYGEFHHLDIVADEFDVRLKNQVPTLDYDLFISTGGPGSPLDSVGSAWEENYFRWLDEISDYNARQPSAHHKHVYLICHSFQLVCRHWDLATVSKRKSTAFGVFPVHPLTNFYNEPVFGGLPDPFYVVDSRDYQVTSPNLSAIAAKGGSILAIEKERPHVPLERAVMALRFTPWLIGSQFHPEADALGMSLHLQTPDKKATVIENHGREKWNSMIEQLNDPDKIMYTYAHILPNFLTYALGRKLTPEKEVPVH